MKKTTTVLFFTLVLLLVSKQTPASSISQCKQPDGSILFTNQGCSRSSHVYSKTRRKNQHPFKQAAFIQLQKKLLGAKSSVEMEKQAKKITTEVSFSAQQGKLNAAYNMIAATYAKLSKHLKKKQKDGQSVKEHTNRLRQLFEEILITQSTISTSKELNEAIQTAWLNYQSS